MISGDNLMMVGLRGFGEWIINGEEMIIITLIYVLDLLDPC